LTTTVYRVEHGVTGDGPYIRNDKGTNFVIGGLHEAHNGSTKHPGPYGDSTVGWHLTEDHIFGFGTREQLDGWFKGFKRKLHEAGFVIRIFEAPDETTIESEFQTIFIREESELVQTIPVVRWGTLSL
jgi:hypothetical protein